MSLHALAEENVFYPSLAVDTSMSGQLMDSFKEHGEMKAILGELAAIGNVKQGFSDLIAKLMKKVEHNVREEEDKVFPAARELLGAQRIQALAQQIEQAKSMSLPSVQSSVPAQEMGMTGGATCMSSSSTQLNAQ